MIIYCKDKHIPLVSEMIVIDLPNGYNIITTRTIWNQGVVLTYKYSEHYSNEDFIPVPSKVDYSDIEKILPAELKYLCSLIGLVDFPEEDINTLTIEDKLKALSIVLSSIYPLQYFEQPLRKRNPIRFVKSVVIEGNRIWNDFLKYHCIPYDKIQTQQPQQPTTTQTQQTKQVTSNISNMFSSFKKSLNEDTKKKEEPEKKKKEEKEPENPADALISSLLGGS